MRKYQQYVSNIKLEGFKHLVAIPVFVGLLIYLAPTVFQLVFNIPFPAPLEQLGSLPGALSMVATVVLALILIPKIFKTSSRDLGLIPQNVSKQSLVGFFGGLELLSFVVLVIVLLGGVRIGLNPSGSNLMVLATGLLFFLFQGTWEEIIYRSYLMPHFSKFMGDFWSIILSSALFTLGHALNPGMQLLPVINLFVASIVFSLVYYHTGSLLIVGIGHGIWNFSQGFVFGAEVSGNAIKDSIMVSKAIPGMELISGGGFGFEGGLVTTITALALIIFFVNKVKNKQTL